MLFYPEIEATFTTLTHQPERGDILEDMKYRVIHKSLRDFRPQRYSSRDGHAEGEHVNRGRDIPNFYPTTLHVCGRILITGLTSAASPRVAVSRTCKVGQQTWSVSPSVDMLSSGVNIPATVPQRSEIPEGLVNYPVQSFVYHILSRRSGPLCIEYDNL